VNLNEVEQVKDDDDSEAREVGTVWFLGQVEKVHGEDGLDLKLRIDAPEFAAKDDGWKVAVNYKKLKPIRKKPKAVIFEDVVEKKLEDARVKKMLVEKAKACEDDVRMINGAEKEVDSRCQLMFHATDSKRMLAAVSRIMEADNTRVFSKKYGCYIENDVTGERMTMQKTRGVFHVKVKMWDGDKYVDGEIVIDSGAADNVMPKEVLKNLDMLEKEAGVRFQGANGAEMGNYGRKKIDFIPAEWYVSPF
jgi:hypothetical protein